METYIYSFSAFILGIIVSALFLIGKIKDKEIEIAKLSTELKEKEEKKENEKEVLETIKTEFAKAAGDILIEKQKNLQETNKISLESFLNPLKEKIKEFQEKVEKTDKTNEINTAVVKEKIEDLIKQNQITCDITEKLSNAISQNSKFRGNLGEMVLDKLLKSSGLIDKKDNPKGNFETQKSFKPVNESGTRIVDAVIYLADGTKNVVIDSKAPLANFIDFINSEDENEKAKFMDLFLKDAKARVDELSNKYTNLEGLNTPDFTIMFIPFEMPLNYIYSNYALIEYAIKQNVIISGPSTLIATLRIINYSWAEKNQYNNIKEIIKLGNSIYEKCITFIQKMEDVQTGFETLKNRFDGVFKTIKGKGGLVSQTEKLKDFGLSPSKEIDKKYIEEYAYQE